MALDVMLNPKSTFELRRHLADDHGDDRRGAAWMELDLLHEHAHTHDAGHTHEKKPA